MRGLIFSLVLALPMLAADQTTLTIQVTSQAGKPVENASITVKFVKGRSMVKLGKKLRTEWDLHTNQEGIAKLPPIPQGTILVQIHAANFQTFGQSFDVNDELKTLEIKLNPPQPQYSAH
jgi:hypothetical protein